MFKKISLLIVLIFVSCNFETPTKFSSEALNDTIYNVNDASFTFQEVINQHKGKKILIDVWASWCRDCLEGLPKVKQLQKEFSEVSFLFLSVDKRKNSWKRGILHYKIEGEHYNLPKGMKEGSLVNFLSVGWIPRYVVVDEKGEILLFKATDASDKRISEALKKAI